jgi:uncharacterized membrane protein
MIKRLRNLNRLKITILLAVMSLFSFGLSVLRFFITDTKVFLFLNWNLFLAFIPWLISSFILIKGLSNRISLIILIFSWLIFFPNSPYILTDLFHLRLQTAAPIWYDLIVVLSFAWTGLLFGFISLMDIEELLRKYINRRLIVLISIVFLFLGSFGIYLGRFLRWNSWDLVSNPSGLFYDISDRIVNPFSHPRTWGLTILMGILLNMMYFSFKLIKDKK